MKLVLIVITLSVLDSVICSDEYPIEICFKKKNMEITEKGDVPFQKVSQTIENYPDIINFSGFNLTFPGFVNDVITGNVIVGEGNISNYKNITVCTSRHLIGLKVNFTINTLDIDGSYYNITSEISDIFDLYGAGKFQLKLKKIAFALNISLLKILLDCIDFDILMTIEEMKANFEGVMGGDPLLMEVINRIIGQITPDFIDYYWPTIKHYIEEALGKHSDKIELADILYDVVQQKSLLEDKIQCWDYPSGKITFKST